VHAYDWEAHRVFQNVNALFCVKGAHLLQSFWAGRHVEVVVIAQPVCKRPHPFDFEQTFAGFPL